MNRIISTGIFWALAMMALAQPVQWSDIENSGRNMVSDAKNLPTEFTDENKIWEKRLEGKWVLSQPQVVGDKVLFGGDAKCLGDSELRRGNPRGGALLCLDRFTGESIWEMSFPGNTYSGSYGTCTQGTVENDIMYIHSNGYIVALDMNGMADGNDGPYTDELTFFSRFTLKEGEERKLGKNQKPPEVKEPTGPIKELKDTYGDIIWMFDVHEVFNIHIHDASAGTPLIVGDFIWCTTSNALGKKSLWEPTDAPYIVVLDKKTGELVAKDTVDIPQIYHGSWSSLTLAEVNGEKAVIWGDGAGYLRAFAMIDKKIDGKVQDIEQIWRFDANPKEYRYRDGKLILYTRHNQLFPRYRDDVEWFQGENHKENCSWGPCEFIATPVYYDGKIIVGIGRDHYYTMGDEGSAKGGFYCIDPNGKGELGEENIIWKAPEVGRTQCTASVGNGLVFIADMVGNITCLDLETGEMQWQHDLEKYVSCRSQFLSDGKVYVASDKNNLLVFNADREKEVLSETRMPSYPTTPGVADGYMYFGAARTLVAYKNGE